MRSILYSGLLFLLLVFLIVGLALQAESPFQLNPDEGLIAGLSAYVIILSLIIMQALWVRSGYAKGRKRRVLFAQSMAIFGLFLYHFIFTSHAAYEKLPAFSQSGFLFVGVTLALYFLALWTYDFFSFHPLMSVGHVTASEFATAQLRFFIPFVLPFLAFELASDLWKSYFTFSSSVDPSIWMEALGLLLFFAAVVIFFPTIVQWIWGCASLPESPLKARLEDLCRRANFKCRDLKLWSVAKYQTTAGIIGVLPRWRYVLFTQKLVDNIPPEEVEAVLAHEIGHSHRRHLVIYPFILMGAVVAAGLLSQFFGQAMIKHFALRELLEPNRTLWLLSPLLILLGALGLLLVLYFRFVFGYFSRTFERQADLHVFQVGVPVDHMISALGSIGFLTGERLDKPNWHHFSVKERMDYLHSVSANPHIVEKHHKKTRATLRLYFLLLAAGSLILFSPDMALVPVVGKLGSGVEMASGGIEGLVNNGLRRRVAASYLLEYQLSRADAALLHQELVKGLQYKTASFFPGLAQLLAANALFEKKEYRGSLILLASAWKHYDFREGTELILKDFYLLTKQLFEVTSGDIRYKNEVQILEDAIVDAEKQVKIRNSQ